MLLRASQNRIWVIDSLNLMQNYKKRSKNLHSSKKGYNFAPQNRNNGSLAEWLGTGLQNRLQRFESARNLKRVYLIGSLFYIMVHIIITIPKIWGQRIFTVGECID